MAEENGTGRLATCPACVERRTHTDEEWAVHSMLDPDTRPESCPDCDAAKEHAGSDATTPGFFRPYCEKHDPEKARAKEAARG